MLEVPNIPHDPGQGVHHVPFDKVIYIEQSDFKEVLNCCDLYILLNQQYV